MDEPSNLRVPAGAFPPVPAALAIKASLIEPVTTILMWNDLIADPPEMAFVMIEFGSLGFAAGATAVGALDALAGPPAPVVAVAPAAPGVGETVLALHALAITRTNPASRDSAGLGTRSKMRTSSWAEVHA
jgi:hypothetical protein